MHARRAIDSISSSKFSASVKIPFYYEQQNSVLIFGTMLSNTF